MLPSFHTHSPFPLKWTDWIIFNQFNIYLVPIAYKIQWGIEDQQGIYNLGGGKKMLNTQKD